VNFNHISKFKILKCEKCKPETGILVDRTQSMFYVDEAITPFFLPPSIPRKGWAGKAGERPKKKPPKRHASYRPRHVCRILEVAWSSRCTVRRNLSTHRQRVPTHQVWLSVQRIVCGFPAARHHRGTRDAKACITWPIEQWDSLETCVESVQH
jgi:hypothetical protein